MSALLEVERVVKSFDGVRAVNDCSLEVRQGTVTGLIGPNGAGKTTLFNLITGFLRPTSGRITFRSQRIEGLPPHRIFRRGIVRTFQIPRELKQMTVLENLMLVPADQAGERVWNPWFFPFRVARQEREIRDKALDILEFVDLWHLRDGAHAHGRPRDDPSGRAWSGREPDPDEEAGAQHRAALPWEGHHLLPHRA
jgi:branched-chain amino acid transport system ATP-binding protein